MFIENDINCFTLSRGDYFEYNININCGTKFEPKQYKLENDDRLYCAIIQPGESFENAIIRKTYDNSNFIDEKGTIQFTLNPPDTEYLRTGKYYFTIKLLYEKTKVCTILPMKDFWITGTENSVCECKRDNG